MSLIAVLWGAGAAVASEPAPVEVQAQEVVVEQGEGTAKGAVRATWEGWRLRADALRWDQDGRFGADGVWLTPCGCESPPWALRARSLEGEVDDRVVLRGGALEVCGKALLPLPWASVSLRKRRVGLMLPRIGHGKDGWVVAQPVSMRLGERVDATVAPEWRSSGALRVLGDGVVQTGAGPDARVGGAIGQGGWSEAARGMADVDLAVARQRMRLGLDGTWLTDSRYLSDYSGDYLSRSAPWTESLLVAGVGPVRLESDTFGATSSDVERIAQRPVAGVLSHTGRALGPLSGSAVARVDMVDFENQGSQDRAERLAAAMAIHGGRELGPVQLEARAEGRAAQWSGDDAWTEGRLWTAARLGFWGDAGSLRHLADLGVTASAARGSGVPSVRLPEDRPSPAWSIGPTLRSQWLSAGGVPVALEASVPWTEDGPQPMGAGRLQHGPWGGRLAGSNTLQEGSGWWDDGQLRVGMGTVHWRSVLQATGETAWTLPPPAQSWRPGWRGIHDLEAGRLLSQGPTLGYDSPCDCLRMEAAASWSVDRDLPEFWVRLDLR